MEAMSNELVGTPMVEAQARKSQYHELEMSHQFIAPQWHKLIIMVHLTPRKTGFEFYPMPMLVFYTELYGVR